MCKREGERDFVGQAVTSVTAARIEHWNSRGRLALGISIRSTRTRRCGEHARSRFSHVQCFECQSRAVAGLVRRAVASMAQPSPIKVTFSIKRTVGGTRGVVAFYSAESLEVRPRCKMCKAAASHDALGLIHYINQHRSPLLSLRRSNNSSLAAMVDRCNAALDSIQQGESRKLKSAVSLRCALPAECTTTLPGEICLCSTFKVVSVIDRRGSAVSLCVDRTRVRGSTYFLL